MTFMINRSCEVIQLHIRDRYIPSGSGTWTLQIKFARQVGFFFPNHSDAAFLDELFRSGLS